MPAPRTRNCRAPRWARQFQEADLLQLAVAADADAAEQAARGAGLGGAVGTAEHAVQRAGEPAEGVVDGTGHTVDGPGHTTDRTVDGPGHAAPGSTGGAGGAVHDPGHRADRTVH